MLEKNSEFPAFSLQNQSGATRSPADYAGRWLIVYFYAKDNTSGCSNEAADFAALYDSFAEKNAAIAGVSPDSTKSHARFAAKLALPFDLLSDPEHALLEAAGVWQKKSMYGREYMGVARTTALVDPHGTVREVWSKVKVPGHAKAVLSRLEEEQKTPAR